MLRILSLPALLALASADCGDDGQLRNIAADGQGILYIGCYEANKVVVFDAADVPLKELPISSPAGIAVLPSFNLP